tara:strand:- start:1713 stop:2378 length:666 start_codon:yes stop_codon:yes gene_type:complete
MSRARDLSKLSNPSVFSVDTSYNVGLNSTTPDAKLDVIGIVSATAFYGDGSNLEGVASAGLGTALADEGALSVIYYTDNELTIGSTITVNPPTSTNVAYTQYAEVVLSGDADLIVAPGDDFIPDVLGLSTESISPISGTGGRVRADSFTNHAGTGAPTFNAGVQVTGVVTATGSIQVGSGQSFGSSGASDAVYYGDGSNLTGVSAGLAASTVTLQTWLFGG